MSYVHALHEARFRAKKETGEEMDELRDLKLERDYVKQAHEKFFCQNIFALELAVVKRVITFVIKRLFSGDEILLVADIQKGVLFNAVKFKQISLLITCKIPIINRRFKEDLDELLLEMTHSGISYQRTTCTTWKKCLRSAPHYKSTDSAS